MGIGIILISLAGNHRLPLTGLLIRANLMLVNMNYLFHYAVRRITISIIAKQVSSTRSRSRKKKARAMIQRNSFCRFDIRHLCIDHLLILHIGKLGSDLVEAERFLHLDHLGRFTFELAMLVD